MAIVTRVYTNIIRILWPIYRYTVVNKILHLLEVAIKYPYIDPYLGI